MGNLVYKTRISFTKWDSWSTNGTLGLLFTSNGDELVINDRDMEINGCKNNKNILKYGYRNAGGVIMTIEEMKVKRKELGLSCRELAELGDLPLATVQKVFSGATKAPRSKTIRSLEKVFSKFTEKETFTKGDMYEPFESEYLCVSDVVRDKAVEYKTRDLFDKRDKSHTVEEYLALPDDLRVELIDGTFYEMLAPTYTHQEILSYIFIEMRLFVKKNKGKCKVLPAPFDIQLDKDNKTMVQPDIVVICEKDRINDKRGYGAPDMVVEILSPSTAKKDWEIKLGKYMAAGVREYWIVDPVKKMVVVFFKSDDYADVPEIYSFDSQVPVHIWDCKCKVDFSQIDTEI